MDTTTLAAWIGHDADQYDLEAAADALDGIDPDADPETAMTILARYEKAEPVEAFAADLYRIAGRSGSWGQLVRMTIARTETGQRGWRCARVVLDGDARHVWLARDGVSDDARALYEQWRDLEDTAEQTAAEAGQAARAAHAAAMEHRAAATRATQERNAAMRAWAAAGVGHPEIARTLGMTQQAVTRAIAGA